MRFVQVENGDVINIIEAEPETARTMGALPYYEGCYMGGKYAPPDTPSVEEQLRADIDYLAALQGVTL